MWISRQRQLWLDNWKPLQGPTNNLPFRRKWYKAEPWADVGGTDNTGAALSGTSVQTWVFPNINDIAEGLVIPKEVIEANDKDPTTHQITIQDAMLDLVEYIKSGRFRADYLSEDDTLKTELDVIRIAQEEGVVLNSFGGVPSAGTE